MVVNWKLGGLWEILNFPYSLYIKKMNQVEQFIWINVNNEDALLPLCVFHCLVSAAVWLKYE